MRSDCYEICPTGKFCGSPVSLCASFYNLLSDDISALIIKEYDGKLVQRGFIECLRCWECLRKHRDAEP